MVGYIVQRRRHKSARSFGTLGGEEPLFWTGSYVADDHLPTAGGGIQEWMFDGTT
jgi:hypothetical protein